MTSNRDEAHPHLQRQPALTRDDTGASQASDRDSSTANIMSLSPGDRGAESPTSSTPNTVSLETLTGQSPTQQFNAPDASIKHGRNLWQQRTHSSSSTEPATTEESPSLTVSDAATERTPLLAGVKADPETGSGHPRPRCCGPHLGMVYALIAAFCSSVVNGLVKGLTNTDPAALSMFRFMFIFIPAGVVAFQRRSIFPRGHRFTLLLRALTGTLALIAKFYALRFMPLADASVILLSAPVFVSVFARLMLKESFTWVNAVTIVFTIAGIVLVIQPPFIFGGGSAYSPIGPILAVSSNLMASNSYVQLRQLRDVHYSVTLSVFCLMAIPVSCVTWLAVTGLAPTLPTDGISWLLIVGVGLLSYLVQLFFTKACQIEDAGPVSVVRTTDIIFAVVWQVVFFHDIPGLFSWIGMSLIVSAVLTLGVYKWYRVIQERKNAPK